ncbi:hypothetical protein GW17_00054015 [Ensete ventricosum]|nr:hypothetical protein GW17_00054015 [Ensete ventricosum]
MLLDRESIDLVLVPAGLAMMFGGIWNSSAGDLKQYSSIQQPGFPIHCSELPHRHLDREQLQGVDDRSRLRGHKPNHLLRQVRLPAHLLLGRLHLLHPVGAILGPRQLHDEHAGFRHTRELRPDRSDQGQQLLVDGSESNVLRHNLAALDLWTHSNVCLLGVHGDDTALP